MRLLCAVLALLLPVAASAAADKSPLTDDLLYDRVIRRLANDRDLKTNSIEVTVKELVVTLRGEVETEKLRLRAETVVRKTGGVKQVVNDLRVRP